MHQKKIKVRKIKNIETNPKKKNTKKKITNIIYRL